MSTILAAVTGTSFLIAGAVARRRRPGNPIGALMLLTGATWWLSALADARAGWAFTLGTAVVTVGKACLLHLLLAFPSGRLRGGLERALVAAGYAVTALGGVVVLAFYDDLRNRILLAADAHVYDVLHQTQRAVAFVIVITAVVVLALRWRAATPPLRRALGPVLAAGAAAVALILASLVASQISEALFRVLFVAQVGVFAAIPFAFLAGLLRSWLSRTGVAELLVELRGTMEPGRLRAMLARTLGDPSLEIAYRVDGGYVDRDGRPLDLNRPGRAVTVARYDGEVVAALVHDPALTEEPELLEATCAAAALALANERLQAQLRARLEDLRASRARLVSAGDEQRRRLERNLHDGAQQRLVGLALALGLVEDLLDEEPEEARAVVVAAKRELATAIEELRELARGLHPAILTERGLAVALESLAERARLPVELSVSGERLPPPVEAALYYVACEAVANAGKYAHASKLSLRVARENGHVVLAVADDGVGGARSAAGSGLHGLADRVEALDGRIEVESPPGGGTTLRAEIPCAS